MTSLEAGAIINDLMQQLWPKWECTDAQRAVWVNRLMLYPAGIAKIALQQAYESNTGRLSPTPSVVINKIKALYAGQRGEKGDIYSAFTNISGGHRWFVKCLRGARVNWKTPVLVDKKKLAANPDLMGQSAEYLRKRMAETYDGDWITLQEKIPVDDGLRGLPAKAEAERQILAGPDTPGRRFLLRLNAERAGKPLDSPEPPGYQQAKRQYAQGG